MTEQRLIKCRKFSFTYVFVDKILDIEKQAPPPPQYPPSFSSLFLVDGEILPSPPPKKQGFKSPCFFYVFAIYLDLSMLFGFSIMP